MNEFKIFALAIVFMIIFACVGLAFNTLIRNLDEQSVNVGIYEDAGPIYDNYETWIQWLFVGVIAVLLIAFIVVIFIRKNQQQYYDDYEIPGGRI